MNKNISKNLATNILAVFVAMLVNFIITPIVTNRLGLVAYSYVGIINNLISFFTVFTYTLNSMVGRFYTIYFQKGDNEQANAYISSALYTCFLFGIVLLLALSIFTSFLDRFIVIEPQFVNDVKLAFFCSCISFLTGTLNSVFATGAYATNKLYITNTYTIVAGIVKAALTYALFKFLEPHVWFISLTNLIQSLAVTMLALVCFVKLVPAVRFSRKLFSLSKALDLLKAGAFNAVIMMGNTLMTQIDLLVGNRLINAEIVGAYSVILTFSTMMRSLGSAISNSFSPTILKMYAEKGSDGVRDYSNHVVNLIGTILGWPSCIIACVGCSFVNIWLDIDLSNLYYVFAILMLPMGANLACTQLYVVQQAVNKLKVPAGASIIAGAFNLIAAIFLAKYARLDIYGIALASTLSFSLRNIVFQPLYTSYITNQKNYSYFLGLVKPLCTSAILYILWSSVRRLVKINNIIEFILCVVVLSVLYFAVSFAFMSKKERRMILSIMRVKRNEQQE